MRRYKICSQRVRMPHMNRCLNTKEAAREIITIKRIPVILKLTPQQEAKDIKRAIANLDYRLEATGEMSSKLWCCLYDAQQVMEQALTLISACKSENKK